MTSSSFIIPLDRLPPGFADRIDSPPDPPARPVPAATAVLLRDGVAGLELLLLRRHRSSGFVPGAYVFPGGRVDADDDAPGLDARMTSLPPRPARGFRVAAARELFEETGVLLAARADGSRVTDAAELRAWREALLADERTLLDILRAADLSLELELLMHCAHWITPAAEPRRYDTHFFLAALPPGAEASADPREMTDSCWVTPVDALARFSAGELPMVFPTVKTVESLVGYDDVAAAFDAQHDRVITAIEPRLVRIGRGVGVVIDDTTGGAGT